MVNPQKHTQMMNSGIDPPESISSEQLVPLVREIRSAIDDLRQRLDSAMTDLRCQIDGKVKSHYTVEEIAELTGRSQYTVRIWIKRGLIHAFRIPGSGPKGRLLVPREELQKLVDRGHGSRLPGLTTS
jgi:excisionase family DNA binding protein